VSIYKKTRLDQLLVDSGLAATRSRAADLVRRGAVTVEGVKAAKPGALVRRDAVLVIDRFASPYVSRGGLKLAAALDAFGFSPEGRVVLDIGASTGGFTDVLLARAVAKVYAVDVGHDQLDQTLRADRRVVTLEATDARHLDASLVEENVGAIVADVSFISLTLVLPAAFKLAKSDAWLVALVKPQFEAGRDAVGKGGIVRDLLRRTEAVAKVRDFIEQAGWTIVGEIVSPIKGGSGNEEFLIGARHGT
jgi:23S rRNA (cytidine1920-2'-O)/16S rRNA (cytidine1409-2'-O)-methyltransferase